MIFRKLSSVIPAQRIASLQLVLPMELWECPPDTLTPAKAGIQSYLSTIRHFHTIILERL